MVHHKDYYPQKLLSDWEWEHDPLNLSARREQLNEESSLTLETRGVGGYPPYSDFRRNVVVALGDLDLRIRFSVALLEIDLEKNKKKIQTPQHFEFPDNGVKNLIGPKWSKLRARGHGQSNKWTEEYGLSIP
ncbi:hypothetical protein ACLOJK_039092 [Asimina triloba]